MKKNGAEVIHLATGLVVGYPPCPRINYFKDLIREKYDLKVVVGTHPIPQKYYDNTFQIRNMAIPRAVRLIKPTLANENIRLLYD